MIKLRCIATHEKYGKFTPGTVCNVTRVHMDDNRTKGVITVECEGVKTTGPFKFSSDKHLITKTEAFRLMLVPNTEPL